MKKLLLAGMLLFVFGVAGAQKVYFMYIQSESGAPFFVKMGDKVFSSTASGYLIMSKLVDSSYTFTIGKAGQVAAEARFKVAMDKKDKGFLLREADNKFNLFNLQEMTLLQPMASAAPSGGSVAKRTDAFTILLAQAANDPSLLEIRSAATPAVQKQTVNKEEPATAVAISTTAPTITEPEPKADTSVATLPNNDVDTTNTQDVAVNPPSEKEESTIPETNTEAIAQQPVEKTGGQPETTMPEETKPYKPSVITRKSESSTTEGFGLVFLDDTEGQVDTIKITIPNQAIVFQKDPRSDTEDSKTFLNITNTDSAAAAITVEAANEKIQAAEKKKNRCLVAASDKDFLKLRKNMAAKETDDAMISEAHKAFKKSCYSTDQIKSLSFLFLNASGKYHFFDAAYGHVSDPEQYAILQAELNDDYYVNRFKALIAKQ